MSDEFVQVVCPYCGTRQAHYLKRVRGPQLILCDCEDAPGCNRYFAVKLTMMPTVEYYALNEKPKHPDCTRERLERLNSYKREAGA